MKRSKKEDEAEEDGEQIKKGGADGERWNERTPYWRKCMTLARC